MFLRSFILCLGMLCGLMSARAQSAASSTPQVEAAIERLELDRATQLLPTLAEPQLQAYYGLRIAFFRYLVYESQDHLLTFLESSKAAIQGLQKLPRQDPSKNVIIAEAFFLRGVAKALDKRYISSTLDFKSACSTIYQNWNRFPDNVDQLKLMGVFHVAMSAIPRKLQWLSNVLCFKGDLYTGLNMLQKVHEHGSLLPNEAQILLFYFNKNILDDPAHATYAREMHRINPESIIYNYLLLSSFLELRDNDAAIDLCQAWEKRQMAAKEKQTPLPIWHYSCGKAYFFKLNYAKAIREFDRFMQHHQGRTLIADALYRKGMSLVLSDQYAQARPVFHALTREDASGFDVDEYASKMAAIYLLREPSARDQQLYEARNLFDGGYYVGADSLLAPMRSNLAALSENQRTELHYRMGRIHHALKREQAARAQYLAAIATQAGRNLWMKVYAHYYLGQLEENNGNVAAAKEWYRKALNFDKYPYQSGLEQRCKAGLARLKRGK